MLCADSYMNIIANKSEICFRTPSDYHWIVYCELFDNVYLHKSSSKWILDYDVNCKAVAPDVNGAHGFITTSCKMLSDVTPDILSKPRFIT